MSDKPTFLLVPGNFLLPAYYHGVAALLKTHSFPAESVTIPSTGSSKPLTSNEPDVVAIRSALESLLDDGKEVIIVAHSYAGVPTCGAVKGLGVKERHEQGKPGGVAKLLFVAAWLLQEGEAPPHLLGKYSIDGSWARMDGTNIYADDPVSALYNDTAADVTGYWSSQGTHSDMAAFATPLKYAAWRHIPTTYLICELDQCVPPRAQEGMVASTEGAVKAEKIKSGHMPMLSMPEKFVEILMSEAGEAV